MRFIIVLLSLGLFTGASAAGVPSSLFRLYLPDFFETPFDAGNSVLEIPNGRISRIRIVVVQDDERPITPGSYKLVINGKGSLSAFDAMATKEGTVLEMTPASLSKRPDELFDPVENTIEVVARDRRGRQYYQNWVIRTKQEGNPLFGYSATVSPNDPQGVPPDILLKEPAKPPVMAVGQQTITLKVAGTLACSEPGASLSINGKTVVPSAEAATLNFSEPVTLDRSRREMVVEAVDRKGHKRRVIVPVSVREKARPAFRFPGRKYALVIGVSRYGDMKGVPAELPGAAADAKTFASLLQETAGFPAENIRLLLDEEATVPQVRVAFSDFLAKAQADDLLVIYVGAHALHDPRVGKGDRLYLALHGTNLSQIDSTGLSFMDLEMMMNRSIRSNQSFLIFDAGHPLKGWDVQHQNLANNHLLNLFSDQEGRSVIVSGSAAEHSRAGREGGRAMGLFNQWMIAGIEGEADLDANGLLSGSELFHFVTAKVKQDSNGAQNPRFRLTSRAVEAPLGLAN